MPEAQGSNVSTTRKKEKKKSNFCRVNRLVSSLPALSRGFGGGVPVVEEAALPRGLTFTPAAGPITPGLSVLHASAAAQRPQPQAQLGLRCAVTSPFCTQCLMGLPRGSWAP